MIKIKSKLLKEALQIPLKVIDLKSTDPTLSHIRLKSNAGYLFIYSTDLESSCMSRIPLDGVNKEIDLLVPMGYFKMYFSRDGNPKEYLEIEDTGNDGVIINNSLLFSLPACEYPVLPERPEPVMLNTINTDILKQVLENDHYKYKDRCSRHADEKEFTYFPFYNSNVLLNKKQTKILQTLISKKKDENLFYHVRSDNSGEAGVLTIFDHDKGIDVYFRLYKYSQKIIDGIKDILKSYSVKLPDKYMEVNSKDFTNGVKLCNALMDDTRKGNIFLNYSKGIFNLESYNHKNHTIYSHKGNEWEEIEVIEITKKIEDDKTVYDFIRSSDKEMERHQTDFQKTRYAHYEKFKSDLNCRYIEVKKISSDKLLNYICSAYLKPRPDGKSIKSDTFNKLIFDRCIGKYGDSKKIEVTLKRIETKAKKNIEKYRKLERKVNKKLWDMKKEFENSLPKINYGHKYYLPTFKEHIESATVTIPIISNGIPEFRIKKSIKEIKDVTTKLKNNLFIGVNGQQIIFKNNENTYVLN